MRALIGEIETYDEGDDGAGLGVGVRRGMFQIAWRLVDADGAIQGRCVTGADSGLGAGAVSYSDLLDGAGGGLANFLLKRKA